MEHDHLKSSEPIADHILLEGSVGKIKNITTGRLSQLCNDAVETIWDYQERCYELRRKLSECIADYERMIEQIDHG